MVKIILKNKTLIIIGLFFLIGAVFRLINWSHFETIAGDEGVQLLTAERLIKYGKFPELGEISALDTDDKYLLHNSPLGYYFLTLIYLIGLQTPEGYILIFTVINLLQAYFLYRIACIFFNQKTGMAVLVLALFLPTMLYTSTWASQPVIAIFFDTIALYLFALFKQGKRENFFISAVLISLLATQFYPPMYLLIPLKAILFVRELKNLAKPIRAIIIFTLGAVAIYLPILLVEVKYDWARFQIIGQYYQQSQTAIATSKLGERLTLSLKQVFLYFPSSETKNDIIFFAFFISAAVLANFNKTLKAHSKGIILLFLFSFLPAVLIAILIQETLPIFSRAYLLVVTPFLLLWLSALLGQLKNTVFVIAIIFLSAFLLKTNLTSMRLTGASTITAARQAATGILNDAHQKQLPLTDIDLLAISHYDPYGWETSYYWYNLEKLTGEYLVDIDPEPSKATRRSKTNLVTLYVICHQVNSNFSINDCFTSFEEKINRNYYGETFILEKTIGSFQTPILVMNVR